MPEESKKTQLKGPRDQRKPRNRNQAGATEKKVEKKTEEPKVPVPQKPVYEEPGPEFYKSLKRETDEILKITEEANSKYKKKEIQSNWSKYEMPIESYDEMEEQENIGADYEKLAEAPLAVGGHFQFKHEKSWDVDTGPSLYDKYFDVDMDKLFLSISTIPFHERINVSKSIFSETDMLTMNNRATRFKQKYYNDKTFTTPELTQQNKIIALLKENQEKCQQDNDNDVSEDAEHNEEPIDFINETLSENVKANDKINETTVRNENIKFESTKDLTAKSLDDAQTKVLDATMLTKTNKEFPKEDLDNFEDLVLDKNVKTPQSLEPQSLPQIDKKEIEIAVAEKEKQEKQGATKNPVIESPEDLEKWLDDFLDG